MLEQQFAYLARRVARIEEALAVPILPQMVKPEPEPEPEPDPWRRGWTESGLPLVLLPSVSNSVLAIRSKAQRGRTVATCRERIRPQGRPAPLALAK